MRIDEVTDADHDAIVALVVERLPESTAADAGWMFHDARAVTRLRARVARDEAGTIIGVATEVGAIFVAADALLVRVVVPVAAQGRGVGRALLDALEGGWPADVATLRCAVYDDDERSLAIARSWGYEVQSHGISSSLGLVDLPAPDPVQGVRVEDAAGFDVPDREAVETMFAAAQTHPEALATGDVMRLDQVSGGPPGSTPITLLARVDGVPAGLLSGHVEDGLLQIHFTGVDPAFRGRGVARAIKQAAHLAAAAAGAATVRTSNEITNTAIRALNADLGYQVTYGAYRLARTL